LCRVAVDQKPLEMTLSLAPVDEEVLHQERCDDHPDPVWHPSLGQQLPHAGVDHGVTGGP
jgi:hypothetical protein